MQAYSAVIGYPGNQYAGYFHSYNNSMMAHMSDREGGEKNG